MSDSVPPVEPSAEPITPVATTPVHEPEVDHASRIAELEHTVAHLVRHVTSALGINIPARDGN